MAKGAVLCVSHGGGPLPVLGDPSHDSLVSSLRTRAPKILSLPPSDAPAAAPRPRAIVVVTAHWQTARPTVSSGASPPLLYDYGGFPDEAYTLKYPAAGSPEVAAEVHAALAREGLDPVLDDVRGWDHGVFVPLMLIRPEADVPVVQVSVLESEDPAEHLRMGRALAVLRDSGVAIVGSGFASFHNRRHILALMRHPTAPSGGLPGLDAAQSDVVAKVSDWNAALAEAMAAKPLAKRDEALERWRQIPGAYLAHPEGAADHFLPLLVCAGAAGEDEPVHKYRDEFVGIDIWSFFWGAEPAE